MGGGRRFHYPKYVWSPSGGWWNNPANWKKNTAIAFLIMGISGAAVFKFSADNEVRYVMYSYCFPIHFVDVFFVWIFLELTWDQSGNTRAWQDLLLRMHFARPALHQTLYIGEHDVREKILPWPSSEVRDALYWGAY